MRLILFSFAILIVCTACEKEELAMDANTDHRLVPNTTIYYTTANYDSIGRYVSFSREFSSDSFLLEARRFVDPIPEAIDDESTNVLTIPLARGVQSFVYTDEELAENGVFLNYEDCFCARFIPYPVTGTVSGTRDTNGNWVVTGSVSPTGGLDGAAEWNVSGIYR